MRYIRLQNVGAPAVPLAAGQKADYPPSTQRPVKNALLPANRWLGGQS